MKKLSVHDWGRMIGGDCYIMNDEWDGCICTVESIEKASDNSCFIGFLPKFESRNRLLCTIHSDYCKPILRSIEDMTEEEFEKYHKILDELTEDQLDFLSGKKPTYSEVKIIDYLDSIGIDQRGWIEQGLAVDAREVECD